MKNKTKTAHELGFRMGDFVRLRGRDNDVVGVIVQDIHHGRPWVEGWGQAHNVERVQADKLELLSYQEFYDDCEALGWVTTHLSPFSPECFVALRRAQSSQVASFGMNRAIA